MELKPIQSQGWKYYYDFKQVSPYSLVIPMQALEDEEINLRVKKFNTFQSLRSLGYIASIVYLLAAGSANATYVDETFVIIFGLGIVADLSFSIASHHQLKRGIERYNLSIIATSGSGSSSNFHFPSTGLRLSYRLQKK